ncbi:MAG: enoyl-CoA hydratase [Gammaproteobacteria bacterium]|nr:enoyl-CoA hydratase [Gammaproteobacteria bacterium]
MSTGAVTHEDRGRVRILTLDRPAAYNALSMAMIEALDRALAEALADPAIGALVITGAGRGFCAGHDLKEMRAEDREHKEASLTRLFDTCGEVMARISDSPKPVIAAVHGVATAAGCQLVASCDLAVAAAGTRFATPGVNIGLFCSTPMVALSRSVARKHALEMLLLGDMIDADHAVRIGLINRVVPEGEHLDAALALAARIAEHSPLTLRLGKAAFQQQLEQPLDEAYYQCARVMVENMQALDAAEGIDAFLEGRKPSWRNA